MNTPRGDTAPLRITADGCEKEGGVQGWQEQSGRYSVRSGVWRSDSHWEPQHVLEADATLGEWRPGREVFQQDLVSAHSTGTVSGISLEPPLESSPSEPMHWTTFQKYKFQRRHPELYGWLRSRLGKPFTASIVVSYWIVDTLQYLLLYYGGKANLLGKGSGAQPVAISAATWLLSLAAAITVTCVVEGGQAWSKLWSMWTCCAHLHFFGISCLFGLSRIMLMLAWSNVSNTLATGFLYMPISVLLGVVSMRGKRVYGVLEYLALGIMTCSATTFMALSEPNPDHTASWSHERVMGVVYTLVAVVTSALASTLAERIYKNRTNSLQLWGSFHLCKCHLDGQAFVFTIVWWVVQASVQQDFPSFRDSVDELLVKEISLFIVVSAVNWWLVGYCTKFFSTPARSFFDSLVAVSTFLVAGSFTDSKKDGVYMLPRILLFIIVIVATLIFQTGRINIAQTLGLNIALAPGDTLIESVITSSSSSPCPEVEPGIEHFRPVLSRIEDRLESSIDRPDGSSITATDYFGQEPIEDTHRVGQRCSLIRTLLTQWPIVRVHLATYAALMIFVAADATRTLSQQQALSQSAITPQSMVLSTYLSGITISTLIIAFNPDPERYRWEDIQRAYSIKKIVRFMPPAFFFAMASTFLCLAYGVGVSASLATALGYVYMPISALVSRWVLGKYYIWLEWFALAILTCASALFGFMQSIYTSSAPGSSSSMTGMLFVVCSACCSVLGSLLAERLLKDEQLPFYIQKVRLDIGSALATIILIPIIGYISDRPQDAFWKRRQLQPECVDRVCMGNSTCSTVMDCTCLCASGLFVAWDNWLVILALFANVSQSWLTGKVIKQFSTVLRAIAQSSTLLFIYFLGDPLLEPRTTFFNTELTLVALMVPFSTATFMVSVSEMKKVMET